MNYNRRQQQRRDVSAYDALITTPAVVPFALPSNSKLILKAVAAIADGTTGMTTVGPSNRTIKVPKLDTADPVTTWTLATVYSIGDIVVVPSGAYAGRFLECSVGGTSDATPPTGPGTDNTVTWIVDPDERSVEGGYYHHWRDSHPIGWFEKGTTVTLTANFELWLDAELGRSFKIAE